MEFSILFGSTDLSVMAGTTSLGVFDVCLINTEIKIQADVDYLVEECG